MMRKELCNVMFGSDYDAVITGIIKSVSASFKHTEDIYFEDNYLIAGVESILAPLMIEYYREIDNIEVTEELLDYFDELQLYALAYCYAVSKGLGKDVLDELMDKLKDKMDGVNGCFI